MFFSKRSQTGPPLCPEFQDNQEALSPVREMNVRRNYVGPNNWPVNSFFPISPVSFPLCRGRWSVSPGGAGPQGPNRPCWSTCRPATKKRPIQPTATKRQFRCGMFPAGGGGRGYGESPPGPVLQTKPLVIELEPVQLSPFPRNVDDLSTKIDHSCFFFNGFLPTPCGGLFSLFATLWPQDPTVLAPAWGLLWPPRVPRLPRHP